ncbi:MAG: hypothetical protein ACI4S9_07620 [Christensenellales bacterium]
MRKKVLVTVLCLALLSAFGMSSVFADTVSTVKGKTISYNMTAEDEAAKFTAYQDPFSQTNPGIAAYGTQALRFFNWMSGGVWEFVVDDDYEKAVLNVTAWANVDIAYGIGESGASGDFTDVNTAVGGNFTTLKQQESVVVGNTFSFDLSGQTFGTGTSLYVFIRGYNAGNHNGDGAQVISLKLVCKNKTETEGMVLEKKYQKSISLNVPGDDETYLCAQSNGEIYNGMFRFFDMEKCGYWKFPVSSAELSVANLSVKLSAAWRISVSLASADSDPTTLSWTVISEETDNRKVTDKTKMLFPIISQLNEYKDELSEDGELAIFVRISDPTPSGGDGPQVSELALTTGYNSMPAATITSVANITVKVGEVADTKTKVTCDTGDYKLRYTSSDVDVVSINKAGVITGLSAGNATISIEVSYRDVVIASSEVSVTVESGEAAGNGKKGCSSANIISIISMLGMIGGCFFIKNR